GLQPASSRKSSGTISRASRRRCLPVHLSIGDAENVSPAGGGGVSLSAVPWCRSSSSSITPAAAHDIPLRSPVDRRRVACNACRKMFTGARCCNWLADHLRIEHLDQRLTLARTVALSEPPLSPPEPLATLAAATPNSNRSRRRASAGEGYAYCCGLCNETYTDLPSVAEAFSDLHPEFASQDELVAAATAPLQQQQQQILYACTLCSQSFDQLMSGQLHLQRNHPMNRVAAQLPAQLQDRVAQQDSHLVGSHQSEIIAGRSRALSSLRVCQSTTAWQQVCPRGGHVRRPEQLYEHYTAVHSKPMSAFIVETTAAAVAAGGDTLYECGGCKARYKDECCWRLTSRLLLLIFLALPLGWTTASLPPRCSLTNALAAAVVWASVPTSSLPSAESLNAVDVCPASSLRGRADRLEDCQVSALLVLLGLNIGSSSKNRQSLRLELCEIQVSGADYWCVHRRFHEHSNTPHSNNAVFGLRLFAFAASSPSSSSSICEERTSVPACPAAAAARP
uniref:C2H2-type domain-containing protein n=1 Tax=Macrostomum lignano TaxID=282301 RepID=A0A1I8FFJ3_9PLAT